LSGTLVWSKLADMPTARVNGLSLFYEDVGEGTPLVFVH